MKGSREPTVQLVVRVPVSLAARARECAAEVRPGVSQSGTVRLALARLAGMSDEYADELSRAQYVHWQTRRRMAAETREQTT